MIVGDPVWAVLIPPRLERFRELTGLGDVALTADFTGFNKYVLLAGDRVFLFPREPANVAWFEHELAVYRALAAGGFALAPQVRGQWRDESVYPFPFAEVTRLTGQRPADPAALFGPLGAVLAGIHQIPPPLGPVLVHGDIHEDQLLADGDRITGILDWETARVDHPFWDFDLGEWGTGLWRRHRREFSGLWATAWREYAAVRGTDPDPAPLETAFRLGQALSLLDEPRDPALLGTVSEHVAAIS